MERFKTSKLAVALTLATGLVVPTMLPATALAQDHRQKTKNDWRNLGIAGGALGVLGLFTGNKTLAALGIGGGLYSASRYEADRKSQSKEARQRYELFQKKSFDYKGHRYVRHEKTVKGQKQYYFKRER